MNKLFILLAFLFSMNVFCEEKEVVEPAKIKIAEMCISTAVVKRIPYGKSDKFPADIKKVYCWTNIVGAKEPTEIKHVWIYKEKEMAVVKLKIKYPRHRTWSSKRILPDWTGKWEVKILDINDKELGSIKFDIQPLKKE